MFIYGYGYEHEIGCDFFTDVLTDIFRIASAGVTYAIRGIRADVIAARNSIKSTGGTYIVPVGST